MERPMTRNGEPLEFAQAALASDTDHCILWPFNTHPKTGYGQFEVEGKKWGAHRWVCTQVHGEPVGNQTDASHAPGIGCQRHCVNPRHLRWASRKENLADRLVDGTVNKGERHGLSKLDDNAVREIRRRYALGGVTLKALAGEFGVHRVNIGRAIRGETWTHVT